MVEFETAHTDQFTVRRVATLNAELDAAREATRLKSELVATVSHELRTPLASVLGFAELLLRRDLDAGTRERYVQTIHDEAQRLAQLVDDFLDLERIEAGHFTLALDSFELIGVLQRQLEIFSVQSANHTLSLLTPDGSLPMVGDCNRVGQVVANLLSNAIKYSPDGGAVTITATARDGFVHVEVKDPGLGIPAEQQAQVFTKFFRVDSSDSRDIGGTGLGLALCQEIVAAHGGRMGFESREGAGSSFWFELPGAARGAEAPHLPRVLVLQADAELATEVAQQLALDSLDVELVATGVSGLDRALALPPALICLDIDLAGELDGWQVMVRLKASQATAQVPVIVCGAERGRSTAATLGAAGFQPKPFTPEQLRKLVARQLSGARMLTLVVGGDEMLRRLVVETLARDGGDLREAADGLEALALIEARQPDVLVLDLPEGGPEAFETIERLLEDPRTRGLPVVMLTGHVLSVDEERFLKEHSVSLIQKSEYSSDQLRRLIQPAPARRLSRATVAPHTADPPWGDTETSRHAT